MKFYLEQLFYALTEQEVGKIKSMDVKKSKMKHYIEILIENRDSGIPSNNEILKKLDIDATSFTKLRSVTLSRCQEELVPEGGIALLNFLGQHRLPEMLMREAQEQIRNVKKETDTDKIKLSDIYLKRIQGYIRLPYSSFKVEEMDCFIKEYLNTIPDTTKPLLREILNLNKVFILIVKSYYAMDTSDENYRLFSEEIQKIDHRVKAINSSRLHYFMKGIKLILDFYYKASWVELEPEFNKLVTQYTDLKDPGTSDELIAVRFYQAYCNIMMNNFSKANELLLSLKNDYTEVLHFHPKIIFRYALSLLMDGKSQEAKSLMETYLSKDKFIYDADVSIMCCITNTAYHLLGNDIEGALKYINLYNSISSVKDLLAFRMAMRMFEVVYYFQRGDEDFALLQLRKTSRYAKDREAMQGYRSVSQLNNALSELSSKLIKGETDLHGFEAGMNQIFRGNQVILSKLLINAVKLRGIN